MTLLFKTIPGGSNEWADFFYFVSTPYGLTARSITATSLILSYQNSSQSSTIYKVSSNPVGAIGTSNTLSMNVSGLTQGTTYALSVTATKNGLSSTSASAFFTTRPVAPTVTGVNITGKNTATVSYSTTNGSATTYSIITSPAGGSGSGNSPINVSGLTAGTAYTFAVIASSGGTNVTSAYSSSYTTNPDVANSTAFTKGYTLRIPSTPFSSTNLPTNSNCIAYVAMSDDMQIILYVLGNAGVYQSFYLSTDKGASFRSINGQLPNLNASRNSVNRPGLCTGAGVSPDGTLIIISLMYDNLGNTPAFYVLSDSGRSFTSNFAKYTGCSGTLNLYVPQPSKTVITSDKQWCYIVSHGGVYSSGAFRNTNAGDFTSWTGYFNNFNTSPVTFGISTSVISTNSTGSIVYASEIAGALSKSTNYGANFSVISPAVTVWGSVYYKYTGCACSSDGNVVYTAYINNTKTYFSKSTDGGSNWTSLNIPGTTTTNANTFISSIVCDSTGNNVIVTVDGTIGSVVNVGWVPNGINPSTTNAAYISNDGGSTWTGFTIPADFNPLGISAIVANTSFNKFAILTSKTPSNYNSSGPYASGFGNIYFYEM